MLALASERRLLNAREAGALLGVSPLTVRRLAAEGVLEPVRFTPTSRLRFRRDDVERLIAPSDSVVPPTLAGEVDTTGARSVSPGAGGEGATK